MELKLVAKRGEVTVTRTKPFNLYAEAEKHHEELRAVAFKKFIEQVYTHRNQ